ncbi:MAG: putative dsRNA-binding protein [Bacteroidota bacterium]
MEEKMAGNRRVFTVGAVVDGTIIAQGQGFNKKYASQVAAQLAIEKLQLI